MTNLLTLRDLREVLYPRYSIRHLRYLSQTKVIPTVKKIGRFWLYDPDACQRALNQYNPGSPSIAREESQSNAPDIFGGLL